MGKSMTSPFSSNGMVGKGWSGRLNRKDGLLKSRFDTLLNRLGKKPSEVYHKLGIDKADWSRIVWGQIVPPISVQVKISNELECDSSVLWMGYIPDIEREFLEGENEQ